MGDRPLSQYRAKNDMVNPVAAGFVAGGILARNAGPKAVVGGGLAFAAFSAAIDLFLRRETPDSEAAHDIATSLNHLEFDSKNEFRAIHESCEVIPGGAGFPDAIVTSPECRYRPEVDKLLICPGI
ncbi:hypothetical protein NUW54_g12112 [Trametes sanguinea]|uniref:Uncharacterized protein n=1 Tax=Trametes sanguinea TaxID=158606 RepID=A0ACC1N3Z4_9APHY|nr:hypothetical protein NUW54_g12112 [Trametes sanguinea]